MKLRFWLFSGFIIGIILLLIFFNFQLKKPSSNKNSFSVEPHQLSLTKADKYIPSNAYLTIHLHIDPNQIPQYLESKIIHGRQNNFNGNLINLRDGLVSIIGIDFNSDLSNCLGSNFSISIINTNEEAKDWLIAIEGNDNLELKECINKYWKAKDEKNIEIKQETYKDLIISSYKKNKKSISTVVLDDNVSLISSTIDSLSKYIDLSYDTNKNLLGNKNLNSLIKNIDDGIALINASPEALQDLSQIPNFITNKIDTNGAIASIMLKNNQIHFDSIFQLKDKDNFINSQIISDGNDYNINVIKSRDIALINNPKRILDINNKDIYDQLIAFYLNTYLKNINSDIARDILHFNSGEIMLENNRNGWAIESKNTSIPQELNELLMENNYTRSTKNIKNKIFNIWSKFDINELNNNYKLSNEIGVISSQEEDKIRWANNITNINNSEQILISENHSTETIQGFDDNFNHKLLLSSISAKKLLNQWKPLQLLKTVDKNQFRPNVNELILALGAKELNEKPLLHLHAMLSIE